MCFRLRMKLRMSLVSLGVKSLKSCVLKESWIEMLESSIAPKHVTLSSPSGKAA